MALAIGVAVPASIGLALVLRRPGTRVAWIALLGSLSVGVVMAAAGVAELVRQDDPRLRLGAWALLGAQQWMVLFFWPLALAYLFPDGRLPSRRWRPVAALALASGAGAVLLLALQPTLEDTYGEVANPIGLNIAPAGTASTSSATSC